MHSPKGYLNGKILVTFRSKHPKRDQNLQFTPLGERTGIPITFIREFPFCGIPV